MMAIKKTQAEFLFKISRISNQSLTNCRISSPSAQTRMPKNPSKANIAPDAGDNGVFRRLFHERATFQPAAPEDLRPMHDLMEELKAFDFAKDRIRLDGLCPPAISNTEISLAERPQEREEGSTVEDARKLLRVAQLETVKSRLRRIEKSWIMYSEFVWICAEVCSDPEQAVRVARTLDESGTIILLGNIVYLSPEQVLKAIGGLIPLPAISPNDPRKRELEEMERQEVEIDLKARTIVRRELWGGLGLLVVQTAGFMRLTFWELSWDVMEPICFFVTSLYIMVGYAFFLSTSKEPCFEGFYQSRFSDKQKQLVKLHDFDVKKYRELRNIFYPCSEQALPAVNLFDQPEKVYQMIDPMTDLIKKKDNFVQLYSLIMQSL